MPVRIVTDSTCDLPASVVSALGIYVVPLYINIGSQSYLDGIDITREAFYQGLSNFAHHPTTAVPSPQKFRAVYNALAEEGANEVVSIHISSALSALVNVAQTAAQDTHSAAVTVIDSRQLSLGTGFLVERAALMARSGCSAAEIAAALRQLIRRTHVSAALDTLAYLRRSGRMNGLLSSLGELLQIKPILTMYDGQPGTERVRTRKNATRRLVEMVQACAPIEKIAFLHSGAVEQAHALMREVKDLLPGGDAWLEAINPVLGAHIGPGVVGFAAISKS